MNELEARSYAWGDGVVAHPFASMLEALSGLGKDLGCGPGDARLLAARDAYLEAWSDQASHAELVQTLVDRVSNSGRVIAGHERIDVRSALASFTVNGAWPEVLSAPATAVGARFPAGPT